MNKEEDDEEDDYMSDKFLQNEHNPGLMPKLFLDRHKRGESSLTKKKTTPKSKQEKQLLKERITTLRTKYPQKLVEPETISY